MHTPIADFLRHYQQSGGARFHMPGHKGKNFLGCEALDITEIDGADSLYEAHGIISESEKNASELFGSQKTCYSTEGSSQCIRAMLYLALTNSPKDSRPVIVAARNVHKAFIYAAAMLDFEIVWLWPEKSHSLCTCEISANKLESVLQELPSPPAAVYLTSPDYLGGMADIQALSDVCHRHGTILAVDNAHGAYLHFLKKPMHPLDLGADICCDSAHKTLPVLTGGAYLHIGKRLSQAYANQAKASMALFGSTSPSYLTLCSLDNCNRYLSEDYPIRLSKQITDLKELKSDLRKNGWHIEESDPLRLTICAPKGLSGIDLAQRLRKHSIECEYADKDFLVLMMTPENTKEDFHRLVNALEKNCQEYAAPVSLPLAHAVQEFSVRETFFRERETIPTAAALGRICGSPTVSCPPAVPIAVSGEQIDCEAIRLFEYYGIESVDVLK